jgi:hypothetical protein
MDPIVKGHEVLTPAHYEEVRLSIGGDTALVGDLLVYDSIAAGSVGATTPATHRDVRLAVAINADTQAAGEFLGWHGQLIAPSRIPAPVAGVDWNSDVALVDGQQVVMLKRGAFGLVTKMIYTDASDNVITGVGLSLSATAGEVRKTVNAFTNGTPTGAENAAALLSHVMEFVGHADAVAEDVAGQQFGIDVMWGST